MPKAIIVRPHDPKAEIKTLKEERKLLAARLACAGKAAKNVLRTWIAQIDEEIRSNSMKLENMTINRREDRIWTR